MYPALIAARVQPARAMQGGRVPQSKRPIMYTLVIIQFSLASLMFIATSVMYSQNAKARREFKPAQDPVVRIDNSLSTAQVDAMTLKNELTGHGVIKSVSASNVRPGSIIGPMFMVRGGADATARSWILTTAQVEPDFFSTLGIPLLAGRDFDRNVALDITTEPIANSIIDRSLADEYGWRNPTDAIGKTIYTPGPPENPNGLPSTVIGVVENANLVPIVVTGSRSTLYRLNHNHETSYFVRISKDNVAAGLAAIDETWRKLSPNVPLKRSFVDEEYEALYKQVTSITLVFRIVALLSLFIGTLGLVGIATHAIAQRTFEIGVRRTFGATGRQVLAMLLTDFSKPILIANLIAWPFAFVAAKAYSSFFADKTTLTLMPFVASLLLGLVIAWLAVLRQATKAARMNPAAVLRHE
jgi:putative ABC transport system permease protein